MPFSLDRRIAPFCGHTRRFLALSSAAGAWTQFYTTGATQPFTGPLVPSVGQVLIMPTVAQ